jgi:hypothetical protein
LQEYGAACANDNYRESGGLQQGAEMPAFQKASGYDTRECQRKAG